MWAYKTGLIAGNSYSNMQKKKKKKIEGQSAANL